MKIDALHILNKSLSVTELIIALTESIEALPGEKKQLIIQEILTREKKASTALVEGIAMPHCRTVHTTSIYTAVGILPSPVMFGENNDKPVHIVFVIVSPAEDPKSHLRHLAKIAKGVKNPLFVERLKVVTDEEEAVELIQEFCNG